MWRGLSKVKSSIWANIQDHKSRSSEVSKCDYSTKPPIFFAEAVSSNWQRGVKIWPFKFHVTSAWQQEHGRHPTWDCSVSSLPALNPLIKLWNRFGLHHDSMQSGIEQVSIISWHAGVSGHISLHAGAVLCQETSRYCINVSSRSP